MKYKPFSNLNPWYRDTRPVSSKALVLALVVAVAGIIGLRLSLAEQNNPGAPNKLPSAAAANSNVSVEAQAEDQIVVRYKAGADVAGLDNRITQVQATEKSEIKNLRVKVIKVPKAAKQKTLDALKSDPRVEFAEPDAIAQATLTKPNDPQYGTQWPLPTTLTDLLWDKSKGGSGTVIAMLDSGLNINHEDLAGQTVAGYDFVNKDSDPTNDETGHGTMAAGVIAAKGNNGLGVAGICWSCKLMPIKVIDASNKTNGSLVADGIRYAVDNGAKIINLSLAGPGPSATVQTALDYATSKGVIAVASAGNYGNDVTNWPSIYDTSIGVAGSAPNDTLDAESSYGQHVDIAAPIRGGTTRADGGYTTFEGTSYSAPVISGILGVLRSAFPNATPAQLRSALISSADPCCGGKISGGRVNAIRAYNTLAGTQNNDTAKPVSNILSPQTEGGTVSGPNIQIGATASDNVAVAKVHIQIDDGNPTVYSSPPFAAEWDVTKASNGIHKITITAYDNAGNASTTVRTVKLDATNPDRTKPVVSFSSPAAGSTIRGASSVSINASDTVGGISRVDLLVSGKFVRLDITSPFGFDIASATLPDGPLALTARAYDVNGNYSDANLDLIVNNNTVTPPPPPGPMPAAKLGDINIDGRVTIADLSLLLASFGKSDTKGDFNKNGRVDISDLSVLLGNFGK